MSAVKLVVLLLALVVMCDIGYAREDDTDINFSLYNELRQKHSDLYKWVDAKVWSTAPVQTSASNAAGLWANLDTGAVNLAVAAGIAAGLKERLDAISTPNLRQCDRISGLCYVCGNGTGMISSALVEYMIVNKIFGQHHVMGDLAVKYKEAADSNRVVLYNTYYLGSTSGVSNFTCFPTNLTALTNCLPKNFAECRLNHYYADREHEFVKVDGVYLLDKIRTGYRYTYTSAGELGGRLFRPSVDPLTLAGLVAKYGPVIGAALAGKLGAPVVGEALPPQEIVDNYAIQGLYCQ
jgi:hypothetical protein